MQNFMSDFLSFLQIFLNALESVWSWLFSTVLGELILFIVAIFLFILLIKYLISLKQ